MTAKEVWQMTKEVYRQWQDDEPFQLAAALAYYTVFSLAPLLLIAIAIAGLFFGREAAQGQVLEAIRDLIGDESARAIQEMIKNTGSSNSGFWAAATGILLLLIGAGGVVGQLQTSLNKVWGVEPDSDNGWLHIIRERIFSYALVLGIGFLLLVSLIVTAIASAASRFVSGYLPVVAVLWPLIDIFVSIGSTTVLFALIYKLLPDAYVAWRDVWVGALITSFLFSLGKLAIGIYLGQSSISSSYGAAGSVVTILLWVYYSALIFFFGAELTEYYSKHYGRSGRSKKTTKRYSCE